MQYDDKILNSVEEAMDFLRPCFSMCERYDAFSLGDVREGVCIGVHNGKKIALPIYPPVKPGTLMLQAIRFALENNIPVKICIGDGAPSNGKSESKR